MGGGLGSKNKPKSVGGGSVLLKGTARKQPAKGLSSRRYVARPEFEVVVRAKSLYNLNNPFDMLTISKYRQQEWNPESMAKYHKAFSDGGRDASLVISIPFLAIFAAEGGLAALSVVAKRYIISGVNLKLAPAKLALSLTSQFYGTVLNGKDFLISDIDFVDIIADQITHPMAGAAISAGVDVKLGETSSIEDNSKVNLKMTFNSFSATLLGTATGWASNRTEGVFDKIIMESNFSTLTSNIANYILQIHQKVVTSVLTPRVYQSIYNGKTKEKSK